MQSTTGRILIISSFDGQRHPTIEAAEMLQIQYQQLSKLRHHLDKILIVVNYARENDQYEKALSLFPDQLTRSNDQGSYGGWRAGYLAFPDFEWYFFIEDDYTFFTDDFDQKWIDMWTPQTSYLAHRVDGDPVHTSCSAGLTRGEILKMIDWSGLTSDQEYDSSLQRQWSGLFKSEGLADITSSYDSPFWDGRSIKRTDPNKPVLIGPMQML